MVPKTSVGISFKLGRSFRVERYHGRLFLTGDAVVAQLKCVSNACNDSAHSHYNDFWQVKAWLRMHLVVRFL